MTEAVDLVATPQSIDGTSAFEPSRYDHQHVPSDSDQAGAAGFELPHFRIGFAIRTPHFGRFSRASQRDAAGVHLFTAFELAHLDGRWSGAPCWHRPTDGVKFALARQ
jgi:hypothetical protein